MNDQIAQRFDIMYRKSGCSNFPPSLTDIGSKQGQSLLGRGSLQRHALRIFRHVGVKVQGVLQSRLHELLDIDDPIYSAVCIGLFVGRGVELFCFETADFWRKQDASVGVGKEHATKTSPETASAAAAATAVGIEVS